MEATYRAPDGEMLQTVITRDHVQSSVVLRNLANSVAAARGRGGVSRFHRGPYGPRSPLELLTNHTSCAGAAHQCFHFRP